MEKALGAIILVCGIVWAEMLFTFPMAAVRLFEITGHNPFWFAILCSISGVSILLMPVTLRRGN